MRHPAPARAAHCFVLVALALAAAGCSSYSRSTTTETAPAEVWTGAPHEAPTRWLYDEAPAVPEGWSVRELLKQVTFPASGTTLDTEARGALGVAYEDLVRNSAWHVLVVGHADGQAEASGAQSLSERRARAVAAHLEARGLAAERVHLQWFGARHAGAQAHESMAQEQERRVEVWAVSR